MPQGIDGPLPVQEESGGERECIRDEEEAEDGVKETAEVKKKEEECTRTWAQQQPQPQAWTQTCTHAKCSEQSEDKVEAGGTWKRDKHAVMHELNNVDMQEVLAVTTSHLCILSSPPTNHLT